MTRDECEKLEITKQDDSSEIFRFEKSESNVTYFLCDRALAELCIATTTQLKALSLFLRRLPIVSFIIHYVFVVFDQPDQVGDHL